MAYVDYFTFAPRGENSVNLFSLDDSFKQAVSFSLSSIYNALLCSASVYTYNDTTQTGWTRHERRIISCVTLRRDVSGYNCHHVPDTTANCDKFDFRSLVINGDSDFKRQPEKKISVIHKKSSPYLRLHAGLVQSSAAPATGFREMRRKGGKLQVQE